MQNDNLLRPTAIPNNRKSIMELYRNEGYEAIDKLYWKTIGYKKFYYFIFGEGTKNIKEKNKNFIEKVREIRYENFTCKYILFARNIWRCRV